jgi:biopolymer transport protein ExbD
MNPKTFIPLFIFSLILSANFCFAQQKNSNELSILVLEDSIAYYNGDLTKKTKVVTVPLDVLTIKEFIKANKVKYRDSLKILVKVCNRTKYLSRVQNILSIADEQNALAGLIFLTDADRSHFNVKDFDWTPPGPVQITLPTSVTTRSLQEFPALMVEFKKDNFVWYHIMTNEDDTVMKSIGQPIKENLKKIIAEYKVMIAKENKKGQYYIKGDNSAKYPEFKEVLSAFKENDVFKFQMITTTDQILETESKETKLDLFMPKDEPNKVITMPTDSSLTLLLLKNNILVYKGNNIAGMKTYDYKNIRQLLLSESKKYGAKFIVLIKPAEEVQYKATIDIVDEMTICNIKRYAMVDLFPVERELVKKFNSSIER